MANFVKICFYDLRVGLHSGLGPRNSGSKTILYGSYFWTQGWTQAWRLVPQIRNNVLFGLRPTKFGKKSDALLASNILTPWTCVLVWTSWIQFLMWTNRIARLWTTSNLVFFNSLPFPYLGNRRMLLTLNKQSQVCYSNLATSSSPFLLGVTALKQFWSFEVSNIQSQIENCLWIRIFVPSC